jgi:protein phosphatase
VGQVRERNEDAYLVREPLFAVADGMGGHRGGDVASELALETLGSFRMPDQGAAAALVEEIKRANLRVMQRGDSDRDLRGMGTTVTAVVADDARAHVAHVGDSRAYLLRDALQQLTEDHTLVQRMVREGKLTPEEAGHHPQRSILTRAVGVEDGLDVDELTLDVHPGDRILLCTDGLTSMVDDGSIERILAEESDPQSAADRLVQVANAAGGDDNITVLVLDFGEGDGEAAMGGAMASIASATPSSADGGNGSLDQRGVTTIAASPPRDDTTTLREGPRQSPQPSRRRRRWIWWAGAIIVLLVFGLIGTRLYVDRQWYVGESDGRVAIYNGIPTKVLALHLSRVTETTELSASRAEQLQPWQDLRDGITAKSLQDAQSIVTQIRADLASSSPGGTG